MSWFTTLLADIGIGVKIAHPLVSVVSSINPAAGSIFGTVLGAVTAVEQFAPTAPSATKNAIATSVVAAAHPSIDMTHIPDLISQLVSILNALEVAVTPPVSTTSTK